MSATLSPTPRRRPRRALAHKGVVVADTLAHGRGVFVWVCQPVLMSALTLAVLQWSVADSAWTLVRKLAGFTGLAPLTAHVLGSGLSWVAPLGYAVLSLLAVQSGPAAHRAWAVTPSPICAPCIARAAGPPSGRRTPIGRRGER